MINVGSSCTQTHQKLEHGGRGRSFSQADQKPVQKTDQKKKGPHEQDGRPRSNKGSCSSLLYFLEDTKIKSV